MSINEGKGAYVSRCVRHGRCMKRVLMMGKVRRGAGT